MASYRIGISGWRYPPWRKVFFPPGLAQKDELAFASRRLNSIEINGTFYSLQRLTSFQAWRKATPDEFVFSVKGPRFITHIKRLRDVTIPLANFFASGILALEEKLGPLLWQLPPNFVYDRDRLAAFFQLLPRDTIQAARLAGRHDRHIQTPWVKKVKKLALRHALEVRHPSFATAEFIALLREHRIAVVVADTAGKWPLVEDVTADFVYVRLHGDEKLYVSGYTPRALRRWARKLRAWYRGDDAPGSRRLAGCAPRRVHGRDVFVYFDNDVKTQAPFDAMALAHRLGIGPSPPSGPDPATVTEKPRPTADWPWRKARAASNDSRGKRARVGREQ